ncbi:hypothetical protein BZA77DRAFT_326028 [Pyronema omphalodes]|nr:hypothetical protein BZA77DRAFT_326028 [Pyronema omphalodes]
MVSLSLLSLFLAISISSVTAQDRTGSCQTLSKVFPGDVTFPNTPDYNSLNTYYANNLIRHPHCIFAPRSTSAVAFALKTFAARYTIFAIRSGGHSWNPGFSSTSNGVLLNLARLNTVHLSPDKQTADIGAGARWIDVYNQLDRSGVSVSGGRAPPVGVGGFSLGGGLSFFLSSTGFAADNVIEYEVATADGKVFTVTQKSHPDLFIALKGSGAPFCVVTRFRYNTVDVSKGVWGGALISGNRTIPEILDQVPGIAKRDRDVHFVPISVLSKTNGSLINMGVTLVFNKHPNKPAVFDPVYTAARKELWRDDATGPRTVGNITGAFGFGSNTSTSTGGFTWTVKAPTKQSMRGMEKLFQDKWRPIIDSEKIRELSVTSLYIPLGPEMGRKKDVMGLKAGNEYLICWIGATWGDSKDDAKVDGLFKETEKEMVKYLEGLGQHDKYRYLNYALEWQDAIGSYGTENVKFLRKIAKQYDPTNVWERLVKGGFKIPKA